MMVVVVVEEWASFPFRVTTCQCKSMLLPAVELLAPEPLPANSLGIPVRAFPLSV